MTAALSALKYVGTMEVGVTANIKLKLKLDAADAVDVPILCQYPLTLHSGDIVHVYITNWFIAGLSGDFNPELPVDGVHSDVVQFGRDWITAVKIHLTGLGYKQVQIAACVSLL